MSPELLRKLSEADLQALAAGDMARVSTPGLQLISGRTPEPEKPLDPTEGMSGTQKVLANIGGGMMNLATGARQLYTDLTGTEEEKAAMRQEVEAKRKRDEALAEATPGGRLLGKSLQVAGSVAPTLALPVGAATRAITALPRAMGVMRAAPGVARLGTVGLAADAAATGAALGAIEPVGENESRGANVLAGAALSAATPLAIAGGNQVRRMVTQSGGGERAAEQVARELGGDPAMLQQTIQRLRQTQGRNQPIPLSTAAQLSDPQLARLEAGSRARSGANWYDFDQAQARAVADEVRRATTAADELPARLALRDRNINVRKAQAFGSINDQAFINARDRLRSQLDTAMRSPESSNTAIRNMLEAIRNEMDRLGDEFGPQHLAQIRQNLSGRYNPTSPNAFDAVPRDSFAVRSVLRETDDILNNVSNNRWQDVVSGYAKDSDAVRSAQAAGQLREAFYDRATGRVQGTAADPLGDVPRITEAGLGRAMNAARAADKDLVLSSEANRRLEAVLAVLRRQNIVQGVKRSATAGGGSNTASDTFAAQAAGQAADVLAGAAGGPAAQMGRGAINAFRSFANEKRDEALAQALQNPQRMIQLIEQQLARGEPLSPLQQQVLAVLRGAPAAAGMSQ